MIIPFDCGSVRLTSPFGKRVLLGAEEDHRGYDLVGIGSSDVCAAEGGTVVHSRIITDRGNPTWQWGNYVCIKGVDGRHYYYCHLATRLVEKGETVCPGDKLGVMGNTGYSLGAHLHFEVREGGKAINPEKILGIPNRAGTYSLSLSYREAIEVLCAKGIINTPQYWFTREGIDPYFGELICRIARKL